MFKKYLQNEAEKTEQIHEGFFKELIGAFKDGYNEESAAIAIKNELRDKEIEIDKAMKAANCNNAHRTLKKLEKSIHKNSKQTIAKIEELKDAIKYCTKLGEFKAFVKKSWNKY